MVSVHESIPMSDQYRHPYIPSCPRACLLTLGSWLHHHLHFQRLVHGMTLLTSLYPGGLTPCSSQSHSGKALVTHLLQDTLLQLWKCLSHSAHGVPAEPLNLAWS